jgi:hypothetical protein
MRRTARSFATNGVTVCLLSSSEQTTAKLNWYQGSELLLQSILQSSFECISYLSHACWSPSTPSSPILSPKEYFVTNGNFKADNVTILGAFEKLQKVPVTFVMNISWSVDPHRTGRIFVYICYLKISRKSVEKIQLSLKSDKNNKYVTWRSM